MTALVSGPGPSLGAGALLGSVLSVLLFLHTTNAAPVQEHQHQVAEYYGETGCYYNFQHYEEGDRIITNEPCLNCTCHNRMLMCYLRVCPFSKAIGQDCTVEKKPEQCCPVITCPEVPVQLVTSSTTAATPPAPTSGSSAVGHPDNYGCTIDEVFYTDGAKVPGDSSKPCELCYCIRNRTACVMQECTLHVEGCQPVYADGVCCPVRYDCDYQEATEATLPETTVRPTPGLILTTTPGPLDCQHDNEVYADGAMLPNTNPCEFCYCMKGDIVCAVQECGTPLEREGKNCTALPPQPGSCCPQQYQCDNGTLPLDIMNQEKHPDTPESSQPSSDNEPTTQATPVEPSVVDNEIDSPGGAIIDQSTSDEDTPTNAQKPETTDGETPGSHPIEEKVPEPSVVEQEHEQTISQVDQSSDNQHPIISETEQVDQSSDNQHPIISETEQENIPPSETSPATIEHVKPAENEGAIQESTAKPEGSDGIIEQEHKPEGNESPVSPSEEKPSEQTDSQTSAGELDTTEKPTHLVTEPVEAETTVPPASPDETPSTLPSVDEHVPHDHEKQPIDEEVPEAPSTEIPTESGTQEASEAEPDSPKEPSETPITTTSPEEQDESTQPPGPQAVESETSVPEESQPETTVSPTQESHPDLDDQTKPQSPTEEKETVGEVTEKPAQPTILPVEQESSTDLPEATVPTVDSSSAAEQEHEIPLHPTETASKEPELTEEPVHATDIPEIATNEPDAEIKPDSADTTPATDGETSAPEYVHPHEPSVQPTPSAPEPVVSEDEEPSQGTTQIPEQGTEIPSEGEAAVTEQAPSETPDLAEEHKPESPLVTGESEHPASPEAESSETPAHEISSQQPEAVESETESKPEEHLTEKPEGEEPADLGTTTQPHDEEHDILGTGKPEQLPSEASTDQPLQESSPSTTSHEASSDTSSVDESTNVPVDENIITTDAIKPEVSTDSPVESTSIPEQGSQTTVGASHEHPSDYSTPSAESEQPEVPEHVTEAVISEFPESTDQPQKLPSTFAPETVTEGSGSDSQGTEQESTLSPSPGESDESEPALGTSTEGPSISDTAKPDYSSSDTTELPSGPSTSSEEHKPEDTHVSDEHTTSEQGTGVQQETHESSEHPPTEPVLSETEIPDQIGEQPTQAPDYVTGQEDEKEVTSQSVEPSEAPEHHHPSIDQTSDTAEGITESGIKVTEKVDDLTSSEIITGGGIAGAPTTVPEQGPEGISPTESTPAHGIVPGEGNCLVEGQSYQNNSAIPPLNPCVLSCRCVSSIVHCVKVTCSPPPAGHKNCIPVKDKSDACCDTYLCDGDSTPTLESDSHMAGGATTGDGKLPESTQESVDESATGVPESGKPETSEESSSLSPEAVEAGGPEHPSSEGEVSSGVSDSSSEGAIEHEKPAESIDSEHLNPTSPEPIESENPEYSSQHPDVHPIGIVPIDEEGASISQKPDKPEESQEPEHPLPDVSGVGETLPDEQIAHPGVTSKPEQSLEIDHTDTVQQTLETDDASSKPEDHEHPVQTTDIESSGTSEAQRPDEHPVEPHGTELPVEMEPTGSPEIYQPTHLPILPVEAEVTDAGDSGKPQTEQPIDAELPDQPDNSHVAETEVPEQPPSSVTEQSVTVEYPSSPADVGKPEEPTPFVTEKPSLPEHAVEQEQPSQPETPSSSGSESDQTLPESSTSESETGATEQPPVVDTKPSQESVEASESDVTQPEHPEESTSLGESEGDSIVGIEHQEETDHSTQLPDEDHEISKPSDTDNQKPETIEPSEIEGSGSQSTQSPQPEDVQPEQPKPEEPQPVEYQPDELPTQSPTKQPEIETQTDTSHPEVPHIDQAQPVESQPDEPENVNLPSTDQPQTEQIQPEETLPDQAKPEEPQPVEVQTEHPYTEQPQTELSQTEQSHFEQTHPEQPQTGEQQPVEAQPEQIQTEEPQPVEAQPEQIQTEEPQPVEAQPEQIQTEEPQPVEAETEPPQAGEAQPVEAQTELSQTGEPQPIDAQTELPQTGEPQPVEAQTGEPQPIEAQPEQPQTGEPQPVEAQTGEPQPVETQTGEPQPIEAHPEQPQTGEPQPVEAQTESPQTGEPQPVEAQTESPQTGESQPVEAEPEQPQTGEPQPVEAQTESPQTGESQPVEAQPEQPQTGEPQPVEAQTELSQTGEPQPVEAQTESPQTGEPQPVEAEPEQPQTGEPQPVEAQTESPQTGDRQPVEVQPESPYTEQPQTEQAQTELSQPDESPSEQHKPEEEYSEHPITEQLQTETPQTEQSQPEVPHPEQPQPEAPQPIESETERHPVESTYTEQPETEPQTILPQEIQPEHPEELHPVTTKPGYPISGESQTEQSISSTYPTEGHPTAQEETQTPPSIAEVKPEEDHSKPQGEISETVGPVEASEAEGSTTERYPEEVATTQSQSSPGIQMSTEDELHIVTSSPEDSGSPSRPVDGGSLTLDQDADQSSSEPGQEGTTQQPVSHVEISVPSSTQSAEIGHVPDEPHPATTGPLEPESTTYPVESAQPAHPQEPNVVETDESDISGPSTDQSHVPLDHSEAEPHPSGQDGEVQTTSEYGITTPISQPEHAQTSKTDEPSELPTPAPTTFVEGEKDEDTFKPTEIVPEEDKQTPGPVEPVESEQPVGTETYPRPDVITTHPSDQASTAISEAGSDEVSHDKITTTYRPQMESEGSQASESPDKGEEPQMTTENVLDEKPTPGDVEPSVIDSEQPTSSSDIEKPTETEHAESEKPTPDQELESPQSTSASTLPSDESETEDHSETSSSVESQPIPTTTPSHSEEPGAPEPVVSDTDDTASQQKPVDQDQTHEQSPDISSHESSSTTEKGSSGGVIEHVTQVSHPIEHATIPGEGLDTSTKKPIDEGHGSGSSTTPAVDQKPQHPSHPSPDYENFNTDDGWYPPSTDEDWSEGSFGPGTCRYGGKLYVSAQQIPRDDPCDFCFCFRSDIICLRQSCPPPIPDCHQEPIEGFCCPRYQCEVSTATMVNVSTTTTTTTTTLPPHFLSHAYKGAAVKTGCLLQGKSYKVGEKIQEKSTPCLECLCGGNGDMQCNPRDCQPEPMLRKMIMAAASRRR